MTGSQIKDILEDVCDNLFNADPYYQQGGDMVRVGGLTYTCTPAETVGKRISDLKLDSGRADRGRQELQGGGMGLGQRASGHAGMGCGREPSAFRQVAERNGTGVTLKGVDDNPGIAGQDEAFRNRPT